MLKANLKAKINSTYQKEISLRHIILAFVRNSTAEKIRSDNFIKRIAGISTRKS